MKPESFLSLRDYFNYYISGLLWCLSFVFFGVFLTGSDLSVFISAVMSTKVETGGTVILGLLVIFVPYVVGFVLSPLNEKVRQLWQGKDRRWRPNPRKYILMPGNEGKDSDFFEGRRISKQETKQILDNAEKVFGIRYLKDTDFYFDPMRAYVLEHAKGSVVLTDRGRDITNFTESLLLPVPILFISLGFSLIPEVIGDHWGTLLGLFLGTKIVFEVIYFSIALAIGSHYILLERYFRLEEYWVKHVYRAFLVIAFEQKSKETETPSPKAVKFSTQVNPSPQRVEVAINLSQKPVKRRNKRSK